MLVESRRRSAARFANPTTASRTEPWPRKLPMLSDFCKASSLSRNGFSGTGEPPSGPSMIVVTPWRT